MRPSRGRDLGSNPSRSIACGVIIMKFLFGALARFIRTIPIGTIVYLGMIFSYSLPFNLYLLIFIIIIDLIDSWVHA